MNENAIIETIGKYTYFTVRGDLWRVPAGSPIDAETGLPVGGRWEAPGWLADARLDTIRKITAKFEGADQPADEDVYLADQAEAEFDLRDNDNYYAWVEENDRQSDENSDR